MLEGSSEHPMWELTDPVPLDDDGSSVEAVLGNHPDVHYIYVCTKVGENNFHIVHFLCVTSRGLLAFLNSFGR